MARRLTRRKRAVHSAVPPTVFAYEQHAGLYRIHHWPVGTIETGVEASYLNMLARAGSRVVVTLAFPRGWVCDLHTHAGRVKWVHRPATGATRSASDAPVQPA